MLYRFSGFKHVPVRRVENILLHGGKNFSLQWGTPRDSSHSYANAPSPYLPSTPGEQPMTPSSASYLPGTPGGQPMTPGSGGLDIMSPVDGSCRIALGSSGNGEIVTALPSEIDVVVLRKSDKVKIMGGAQRGSIGKLIGVDGSDGIVKVDDTLDVKILDMDILAKSARQLGVHTS
ncbi:hypothetical protein LOK49_LG05G01822 [Camellia lanceoleosa]|uniref:Uncharacterized protein n=1 Tax=Camellia lanceoleosa TaxID=1840588 RepID=A0ACC0HS06_9ERIC|nr:hypothetical protein LOK49_LG05G01822 [Camellia lanceoleosa]